MTDEPTDEALENLFVEETGFDIDDFPAAIFDFARAVLAKWGQPAQAQPDSVQEDAERLDWLEQNLFHRVMNEWDVKFGGRGDQNMWVLFAPKGVQGSARRIIDAARKQGASHDNS